MRSFNCLILSLTNRVAACCLWLICLTASLELTGQGLLPFQGVLTEYDGQIVQDGTRLIRFELYDSPVGGSTIWGGESHRVSINGGLVNVLLGTTNPFDFEPEVLNSLFVSPTYLQVTIDANEDDIISPEDPPLLPRQLVVPSMFANHARNAEKLQNFAIFF